jgi:hypothetical protein
MGQHATWTEPEHCRIPAQASPKHCQMCASKYSVAVAMQSLVIHVTAQIYESWDSYDVKSRSVIGMRQGNISNYDSSSLYAASLDDT